MSEECIFCQIVDGDIPARTVYEDDDVLAFLDANPLASGHTLVIPKEHHQRLEDVPPEPGEMMFAAIHYLAPIVEDVVDADALSIGFNDGEAAGQEVPHVHGHIIPRFDDDGGQPLHSIAGKTPDLSDDDLDEIAEEIHEGAEEQ